MNQWYLIKCKAREEERARDNLANQGYSTYLPMIKVKKRRAGKLVDLIETLFPGYLFINLDSLKDNWSPIRSTRGVLQLVRFGAYPSVVPNEVVDALKCREQQGDILVDDKYQFSQGDTVRVTEGCFAGIQAVFEAKSGEERSFILLNLIGQDTSVCVDTAWLEKVASSKKTEHHNHQKL